MLSALLGAEPASGSVLYIFRETSYFKSYPTPWELGAENPSSFIERVDNEMQSRQLVNDYAIAGARGEASEAEGHGVQLLDFVHDLSLS